MSTVKLIAHGGYSEVYPENTAAAFQAAAQYHPFAIEMDIVLHPQTKELICFHPSGPSSPHGTYTLEEITTQLTSNDSAQLPTLASVLNLLGPEQRCLLDFKQPTLETFQVLKTEYGQFLGQCIFGLRLPEDFPVIKELFDNPEVLALYADPAQAESFKKQGGKYFRLIENNLTDEKISAIHDLELEVWAVPGSKAAPNQPRTAGQADKAKLKTLFGLGVDAILVNDIKLATEILPLGNHPV